MTLLASESPESATYSTGMRPWAGSVMMVCALILVALLAGLIVEVNNQAEAGMTPQSSIILILVALASMLVLMALVVIRRATKLWQQARDGLIGTRLQSRILIMFCAIAILPTLIVSVFSAAFFNFGVQSWFDTRVTSALEDSVTVAAAYLNEHKSAIRTDADGLGQNVQRNLAVAYSNPSAFRTYLTRETSSRNLSEAVVFDRNRVLARTALSFSLIFERLPEIIMDRADQGQAVIFDEDDGKIQAVVKISAMPEMYLLVGRMVDPTVMGHMKAARDTVAQFRQLKNDIRTIQKQFFAVFTLVALLVLLASIWAGMMLAVRLIGPIAQLMMATERVRAGDYSTRVPEGRQDDEIANLGRTFNRMTGQLEAQRRDLMEVNRQLDERRRFTEAVLSGVSAGIVAIDSEHRITLYNRTARELLCLAEPTDMFGTDIARWLPEARGLIAQAERKPERIASGNASVLDGEQRISLHVQVTAERLGETIEGFIVTFDDISELVSAQRSAAWADVARRIAHEIKNPLTPITLSVDRLRKKFGEQVSTDKDAYERYLETISRHVRDIGRMVEEFVAFARMPAANYQQQNVIPVLKDALFSEQTVHPEIRYTLEAPSTPLTMLFDESQLGQVFLNLLKNAAEALEASTGEKHITLRALERDDEIDISIRDNGPGFPADKIATLTEPYVTTRVKGTGLGLAIVKRTVEEHKGSLTLSNAETGGAEVTLRFPKK